MKVKIKKWLLYKEEFGKGNVFKTKSEEVKNKLLNQGFRIIQKEVEQK